MKYRWSLLPAQPTLAGSLASELGISPLLAQCLLNRGLTEAGSIHRFLEPRLKQLADPFLLPDMRAAVDRLFAARRQGERVVIFGDYDVDGVTATALLREVLVALGWTVEHYLPHRLEEGYGLGRLAAENCLRKLAPGLLLAVDCGSTAVEPILWLREQGVDVIVLDHHQAASPPPPAFALVNPQCRRSEPVETRSEPGPTPADFKELCSAGLAFKLAHALVKEGRQTGLAAAVAFDLRTALDLVALGTIADLVPLSGENRILVSAGLERMRTKPRPGLVALRQVAGIHGRIGGYEVGFQLGPRLNAAGRLETAGDALRLLLAASVEEAEPLARNLDACNRERQQIEREMAEKVIGAVRARFNPAQDYVIVEGQASWHIGVVGIVASRVLHEFHRPTVILGGEEGQALRGSGRSIDGFDLAAALRACDDLLDRHGGHAMAAGLSIRPENLDRFRARLNEVAQRTLKPEQFQPLLRLDAEVTAREMTLERLGELDRLQQTGMGNPPVHLVMRGVTHQRPPQRMGADRRHAKMWFTDGGAACQAVLWNAGENSLPAGRFDVAFNPHINEFNGASSVQLKVLDWQPRD
jgi:single-stranded-DNA-specific exonuclease